MTTVGGIARLERLDVVGSTNDVVRGWLADGEPEICVAIADEQTAGRGREGRRWEAPPGAALLCSLGFRPTWLPPERIWRLAATASLAMADAAEEIAGLPDGTVRLKWPNDLVVEVAGPRARIDPEAGAVDAIAARAAPVELRKLGGVLGESDGLGTADPRVVIGIGVNVDWAAAEFPAELHDSMTSLREASSGRPVDRDELLQAFADRLEVRVEALRRDYFDVAGWVDRQVTTGRDVRLATLDGRTTVVRAVGVDALTGALLVSDPSGADDLGPGARDDEGRPVFAGEVLAVRLAGPSGETSQAVDQRIEV